jgi:hypothetical protein
MGRRVTWAAGALVLAGVLSACGNGASSSGAGAGAGTGVPTDASRAAFCKTFVELDSDIQPADIAKTLDTVGTPSGISAQARQGFEVLVAHVRVLPDNPSNSDLTALVKGLDANDRTAVLAFWKYFGKECEPAPTDSPS